MNDRQKKRGRPRLRPMDSEHDQQNNFVRFIKRFQFMMSNNKKFRDKQVRTSKKYIDKISKDEGNIKVEIVVTTWRRYAPKVDSEW